MSYLAPRFVNVHSRSPFVMKDVGFLLCHARVEVFARGKSKKQSLKVIFTSQLDQ